MKITDPIGDMITRIRNGQMRGLKKVSVPGSKLRKAVLPSISCNYSVS